jgi:hypothetical protein
MFFQIVLDAAPSNAALEQVSAGTPWLTWVVLAVIIALPLLIGLRLLWRRITRPDMHGLSREKVRTMWAEIQKTSDQGIMGAKLSIMEADKLLDAALRSLYMPGETLGERLKSAEYKYPQIRNVWPAHKLRNQLAHDVSCEISVRQAKSALRDFESALRLLNVL